MAPSGDNTAMINIPTGLRSLEEPIRVGVIGAGLFGTNLIGQIERAPGMRTAAVADVETEKAIAALTAARDRGDDIATVPEPTDANEVMATGGRAVLPDGVALTRANVDVVVEATGVPRAAARHAYSAITAGTHVVMVSVEADTVIGPVLSTLAERAGVTYSMAYGDQPALITELYHWAETVGLDIVAAGKGNAFVESYRYGTPDDVFDRLGIDDDLADDLRLNPRMYNSFYDGTKVAVEMCAVANATGLQPDVTGMHLPTAAIPEIPEILRPEADGGIISAPGVVDTVSTRYPDGSPVEADISSGVFIVTATPNPRVQRYFDWNAGTGFHTASDGRYQVFYRPHHLPGLETTVSVANAALRNEPTGVSREHTGEVVGAAKRALDPGDTLDGGGGSTVYGLLATAEVAEREGYVPFELLDGAEVRQPVERDTIITAEHVEVNEDTFIYHLRQLQNP